jgi:antitoxin (DNA-binding transcriptional repressor) of toxin-antitoxin stability system
VTLTNSNAAVARLTTTAGSGQTRTVTIGPNQSTSPTSVATGGIAFDPIAGGTTTVSATAPGVIATTAASTQVTVSAPGITLNSNGATIGAGLQNGSWQATLGGSNHGGVTVRIASSNPAVALVSPNATTPGTGFIDVPVANQSASANYHLQGVEGATGTVTITASAPGFTDGTSSLTIVQPAIRLENLPSATTSLSADDTFWVRTGTATAGNTNLSQILSVRAGGSLTVTLTNSNAAVARLTTTAGFGQTRTVTIGPNQSTSPTSVATGGVAFDPIAGGTTTVSATAPGVIATTAASTQVTVSAPGITLNSNDATIGAGLQSGSWQATLGGSNHGGVTVRIASSNPAVALVSPNATTPGTAFIDVPVADLNTGANYYLQGVEGATGTVTISASAPNFTNGTGTLNIVPSALRIEGLPVAIDATAANAGFFVRSGIPNEAETNLQQFQNVRAGFSVTATITNSNATVAQLVKDAAGAQQWTVTIGPNQGTSPLSPAAGSIAFDPLQAGSTTVTASAGSFIIIPFGGVPVEVSSSLIGTTTKGNGNPTKKKGGG